MQSKCPICEIRIEEKNGMFKCPKCQAIWKPSVWVKEKRNLFKKRPSWFTRNLKSLKTILRIACVVLPMAAAVLLVTETVMIGV